jgi:hypothetical protein
VKHRFAIALFVAAVSLVDAGVAEAARVRVVKTRPRARARIVVHPGFPLHRTLPTVVVRSGPAVRVAPRVYLAPLTFGAVVVALPAAKARAWTGAEELEREDGWTDFTMNIDRRGTRLLLEIDQGPAQLNFAEIVFENGETQVVDFGDKVHAKGIYSLLDFASGRKVDHVRVVANAAGKRTQIRVHLIS